MRRLLALTLLLLAIEMVLGMVTNLYVAVPAHHPGSSGGGYFGQSQNSITWALAHSAPWLQAHAGLGLLLVLLALVILAINIVTLQGRMIVASLLGLIGVLGAGAAGLAFLDFNKTLDALLMSVGFAVAMVAYTGALLAARPGRSRY